MTAEDSQRGNHGEGLTRHGHGGSTMRTQWALPREDGRLWASTATMVQHMVAEFWASSPRHLNFQ